LGAPPSSGTDDAASDASPDAIQPLDGPPQQLQQQQVVEEDKGQGSHGSEGGSFVSAMGTMRSVLGLVDKTDGVAPPLEEPVSEERQPQQVAQARHSFEGGESGAEGDRRRTSYRS